MTGKVFRAGNSDVMTLPQPLLQEWGVGTGAELVLEKVPDSEAILVFPARKKTKNGAVTEEFKKWLDGFLDENAEILDELADR